MASPDDLLAEENFPRLNRSFYAAEPAKYLRGRLTLALLYAAKGDEVDVLVGDGLEYRALKLHRDRSDDDDTADDEAERHHAAFITIESEVLAHHAIECLLRLYLAHANEPECPALELARVRRAGDFKRMVRRRFVTSDAEDFRMEGARVFMVTDDRSLFGDDPPPADQWERAIEVREGWLRYFAYLWLERAPAYNVAKHGLGLSAGPSGFSLDLSRPGKPFKIEREDDGLTFLQIKNAKDGPRWHHSLLFVEPDMNFAYVHQALQMIDELWAVARARYVHGELKKIGLPVVSVDDVLRAHTQDKSPFQPVGLDEPLIYYLPD